MKLECKEVDEIHEASERDQASEVEYTVKQKMFLSDQAKGFLVGFLGTIISGVLVLYIYNDYIVNKAVTKAITTIKERQIPQYQQYQQYQQYPSSYPSSHQITQFPQYKSYEPLGDNNINTVNAINVTDTNGVNTNIDTSTNKNTYALKHRRPTYAPRSYPTISKVYPPYRGYKASAFGFHEYPESIDYPGDIFPGIYPKQSMIERYSEFAPFVSEIKKISPEQEEQIQSMNISDTPMASIPRINSLSDESLKYYGFISSYPER